ncbi:MAG: multiple sugar transport system substrate-binding protein [Thermotogota bacterium]|nr:multiple sugar transport system substrate-binding protein [Thermotogota bacterium]MDK2863920.1 multiple sugar transport system substrate-binding protein [Thermotogota bacterium]HCZ06645.1 ABC transporter substrate-binding protein [Thermotogota bacterium]
MRKWIVVWLSLLLALGLFGVTLRVLMEDVPETHIIKALLPEFEAKTGIKVEFEIVQYSDMHAKLVPQLMSPNCQYDLLEVDNYWAGEFPAAGWLEPLDEYVKRDNFDISVYLPSMLDMVGYYNGKLYMIPMYNYAMGLIYRTDVLKDETLKKKYREKYGKELSVPRTLEDYVQICEFIQTNTDLYGSAMQAQRGDPIVMEWSNYLFTLGGDYYDEKWHARINDEIGVKATELYIRALKNAAPPGALSFNLDDAYRVMAQGKAFSMISYNWMLPQLDDPEKSKVAGKVALEPMPGGVGLNGGWGWAIPKNSQHKEEAWAFIKWVESPEIAKRRALMGGAPTRFDVFTDEEVVKKYPWYPKVMWLVMYAKHVPEFQYSAQMIEVVGRELSLAATGEKSIKEALDTAANELDKLAKLAGLWKK